MAVVISTVASLRKNLRLDPYDNKLYLKEGGAVAEWSKALLVR